MTRIVDLDALVPEDIEFQFRGEKYLIPGDIQMEDTFKLVRLYEAAVAADAGAIDERERANLATKAALDELFRVRQPDIQELPFGVMAYRHILAEVLELLGFQIVDETPPEPRPKPKMAVPRSRRSTGSRK